MKRPVLWGGLILASLVTLVWPCLPIPSAASRLAAIPLTTADFHSVPLEFNAEDRALLGKAQAVQHLVEMRGGGRVILRDVASGMTGDESEMRAGLERDRADENILERGVGARGGGFTEREFHEGVFGEGIAEEGEEAFAGGRLGHRTQ